MKNIQEILSVFQEGVFEELSVNDKDVNFKIECKYLADQIQSEYEFFYGVFKSVRDILFVPWDDDLIEIRTIAEIQKLRLEVLSVDLEDNFVKIYCNCHDTFSGGNLFISAATIRIFYEDFLELRFEDLLELSDRYWYHNNQAQG